MAHKSGKESTTPLIYDLDGDDVVVVASKVGARRDPGWYRNLRVHPEVGVQIKGDRLRAREHGRSEAKSASASGGR